MAKPPLKQFVIDGITYRAEDCVQGVLINPSLPELFDMTPNDQRSAAQIKKWWGRPFINRDDWADQEHHTIRHQEQLRREGRDYALSPEGVAKQLDEHRVTWYETYPAGDRYVVRCLDGGAWDRSTNWGNYSTLEEALSVAENGPRWR